MTPYELGQAAGALLKSFAGLWFILVVLVSLASPFMLLSIVLSLRGIRRELRRLNDTRADVHFLK